MGVPRHVQETWGWGDAGFLCFGVETCCWGRALTVRLIENGGVLPEKSFWGGSVWWLQHTVGSVSVNEPLRSSLGTPPHLGGESKMPAEVWGGSAPHPNGATAGQGLGKRGLRPPRHPHVGIPDPSTRGPNPSHPSVAWELLPIGKLEIPRCGAGRGVPVLGKPRRKGSSWGGRPGGAAGSQRLLPFPQ